MTALGSDPGSAQEAGAPSRRLLLHCVLVGGAGAPLVAGCRARSGAAPASSGSTSSGSGPLARVADVPVGGGDVLTEQRVVLTRPRPGEINAFSAVCTHAGCLVDEVADGVITCPCHGSRFSVTDGSVVRGPARRPLPSVPVTVANGTITRS